jgi:hypothetical protein
VLAILSGREYARDGFAGVVEHQAQDLIVRWCRFAVECASGVCDQSLDECRWIRRETGAHSLVEKHDHCQAVL